MRAVIQRVSEAAVWVDGASVGAIEGGIIALIAIAPEDGLAEGQRLIDKIISLRIFGGDDGRFDRSLGEIGGGLLLVSQFTLYGETRKGRRPSWSRAAAPEQAAALFADVVAYARGCGVTVATGVFGAHMDVRLRNDGPVTLILDTDEWSAGRG